MDTPQTAAPATAETQPSGQFAALMNSEHWLKSYITGLLAAQQGPNGIDFKTAEALLAHERQIFETEVAVAMRIFRTYPHLFQR